MRQKLKTFTDFAASLYPHELEWLCSVEQFKKPENRALLIRMRENLTVPVHFDPEVDKRTYSYVKNWVEHTLESIDVDRAFEWIIDTEKRVMLDMVAPQDEDDIVTRMRTITPSHYSFLRFYELLQRYRDYMMVRNRYQYHRLVSDYLSRFEANYLRSVEINSDLLRATERIVSRQFDSPDPTTEQFLKSVYENGLLDGYTRYRAVVRLTVHYYNSRRFNELKTIFDRLDNEFRTPAFYSRRLLANYYSNRAMMYSKLGDLTQAERYATLAIRNPNSDYLLYLINLCVILLKADKAAEANRIMRASIPQLKNTNNKYYKIGFVALHIRTMLAVGQTRQAVDYASNYFNAYRKDIFDHRWHLFMTAYLQALMRTEKYLQIIQLCGRYKLLERERTRLTHADYLPTIQSYFAVAQYMEGNGTSEQLVQLLVRLGREVPADPYRTRKLDELFSELSARIPNEIKTTGRELKAGSR